MANESIPENAREWKISFQINSGVKSYIFANLSQLKSFIKAAREKNDVLPTMPIEPWALRYAFEKADEMLRKMNDKSAKLMIVELEPKETKTSGV